MAGHATVSPGPRAWSFGTHSNSSSRWITKEGKTSKHILSEFHHISSRLMKFRKVAGVVERGGLEIRYTACCIGGSNPSLSASNDLNPNRSLGGYALIRFLFVICFADFRLQWNSIAPSNKQNICPKIETDIIIILMTDLG